MKEEKIETKYGTRIVYKRLNLLERFSEWCDRYIYLLLTFGVITIGVLVAMGLV